eukprot:579514-Pyramimonas_sp.AAC.1
MSAASVRARRVGAISSFDALLTFSTPDKSTLPRAISGCAPADGTFPPRLSPQEGMSTCMNLQIIETRTDIATQVEVPSTRAAPSTMASDICDTNASST